MNSSDEISENAWMLETIFHNTHFMIAYMDKNFNFIRVNEAYAKKSNKTPDFFVGKNHFDLYPHKGNETIFKNVIETGEPYFAYSMPLEHSELGITYWDWVIQPIKEESRVTGILLSLTDVTEYKRNEENIHENHREFMEELVEKRANELLIKQKESENLFLDAANLEIEGLNQMISELKNSNDEFKEIISKYENSKIENEEFTEKHVNEIKEKQKEAEELLSTKNLEVDTLNQKIVELENINNEFKEIISKYEDSKIENEKFIAKLIETHAKELEEIKENEPTSETLKDQAEIIKNINNAVIVIDKKLRIKMWNDAARRIYGWKENEIIGKIAYEVFKSKNTPIERLEILEYLRNNEHLNFEFVHHHKNGEPLNIESTITVKRDDKGNIIEYIAVNHDISELNAKKELLDTANLEIMQLNQKITGLENANDTFKEIISKNDDLEKLFEERVNEVLEKQTEAEELLNIKKLEVEKKDQKIAELESINEELKSSISKLDNSKKTSIVISNDIENEKSEEQFKKLMEDLKHSDEALQQFAYVASHDLQEPLQTISSFIQLLERRYHGKFDKDANEFMEYIVDASMRMQQMIQDLLQYSRVVSRGKEFKPTNAEEILEYAISNFNTSIEENNVELTHDKLPKVIADSGQVLQVFNNLIGNAIKFRRPGTQSKIHISSSLDEEKGEYVFSVSDNGIGIEEQYFGHIFTIFKRLHTKEEYEGTGIGLSVSKRIIERHGGRIWAESEPDTGSIFYFTLPRISCD